MHQTHTAKAMAARKNIDTRPCDGRDIEAEDAAPAEEALAVVDAPELELDAVEDGRVEDVVMREEGEVWVGDVVALDNDSVTVPDKVLTVTGLTLSVKDEGTAIDEVNDGTGESKEPVMPVNLPSS